MGVVIGFAEIKRSKAPGVAPPQPIAVDHERAITDALGEGTDAPGMLAAARPLLDMCRDRYGFVVMREGLPTEPAVLGRTLIELARGLTMLDAAMGAPRAYPTFGVYFSRRQLAWFEDGYSGTTALAVPNNAVAADLAAFVRPRISIKRSSSRE